MFSRSIGRESGKTTTTTAFVTTTLTKWKWTMKFDQY